MKKILLIIGGYSVDYLADMVWISFITNKNFSCMSNIYPSFFFSKQNLDLAWGKGFTIYGKLSPNYIKSCPSSEEIRFLIKTNYYDFISSIISNKIYFVLLSLHYIRTSLQYQVFYKNSFQLIDHLCSSRILQMDHIHF